MIIELDEQEARDFDWFGVDADGHLAHFTTAGFKRLPASVSESAEDLESVTDYFDKNAPIRGAHRVDSESVARFKEWHGEENESRYLASFISMADRGLYSFDIDTYVRPGIAYCRIAIPESPLLLSDLPNEVREIVERTKILSNCFADCSRIDYESTLNR